MQVRYWDLVIGALLVFTAAVTPVEVAFLTPHLDGTFAPQDNTSLADAPLGMFCNVHNFARWDQSN